MAVRLVVKVANIGRDVPTAVTRANMRNVQRKPLRDRRIQAVLWQELDDDDRPDERAILGDLYPRPRWHTWPGPNTPGCHVPITLPASWRIAETRATKVSSGKARVSPDRYVTRVIAHHPDLTDPVAFVNFQLVAGAFTNPGQAAEDYRRAAWAEGFAGVRGIVNTTALDGLTVIGGCDANNPHMDAIHPRAQVIAHRGLDYLWLVEGSTKVRVRGTGTIPLNIDGHEGLFARLDLTSKESA